jgi:hypothetical protein
MQKPISTLIRLLFIFVFSSCLLLPWSLAQGDPLGKITVNAGHYARLDTPVSLDLSGVPFGFPNEELSLIEIKGNQRISVPVQFEPGSPPRLWWILSGETTADGKRIYELSRSSPNVNEQLGVQAIKNDAALVLQKDDTRVLQYNYAIIPGPQGQSKLYDRSGFIHPLWSPSGSVLTNIHPKDHYHHLGIWMPWTHTEFEGKPVDFWNLGEGQGTVRFDRFVSTTSGPVYGGFQAEQDHVALKTSSGEKVVLKEVWDVRVYNVGGPEKGYWLWDFVSKQRCVADSPLKLLQYRYGGFGYRATADWKG